MVRANNIQKNKRGQDLYYSNNLVWVHTLGLREWVLDDFVIFASTKFGWLARIFKYKSSRPSRVPTRPFRHVYEGYVEFSAALRTSVGAIQIQMLV